MAEIDFCCLNKPKVGKIMADNNNFRIAMRGYNKEDVNRFILEGDKLRREAEADLQEKIQAISAERDTLRLEIASAKEAKSEIDKALEEKISALVEAEDTIASLQKQAEEAKAAYQKQETRANDVINGREQQLAATAEQLEKVNKSEESARKVLAEHKGKIDELSASLDEAKNEIAELKQQLIEKENTPSVSEASTESDEDLRIELEMLKAELVKAQMENRTLEEQLATAAPATVTDDALQNRLGEVILQANRTAEQIIREANNTAKLIKMGAVEEATVIKKNFEDKMQQRAERAERLLGGLSEKYFAQFESIKNELSAKVSELIAEKQAELSEKTAAMQKETEEGLLLTDAQAAALMNE